jgi:hypothetical protein
MTESSFIKKLFDELIHQKLFLFPHKGYVEKLGVPSRQGVYVIYDPRKIPVHVGRTVRGRNGLRQRLNQHMLGQSSFVQEFLKGCGSKLRGKYSFRYYVINNDRHRALAESLGVGIICPKHLGLSRSKPEKVSKKTHIRKVA